MKTKPQMTQIGADLFHVKRVLRKPVSRETRFGGCLGVRNIVSLRISRVIGGIYFFIDHGSAVIGSSASARRCFCWTPEGSTNVARGQVAKGDRNPWKTSTPTNLLSLLRERAGVRVTGKIKVRNSKSKQLERLRPRDIAATLRAVPPLTRLPVRDMFYDYDSEADVVYLAFQRPQRATDSEMRNDGIIIHRRGEKVVGLTVLDASKR